MYKITFEIDLGTLSHEANRKMVIIAKIEPTLYWYRRHRAKGTDNCILWLLGPHSWDPTQMGTDLCSWTAEALNPDGRGNLRKTTKNSSQLCRAADC